jgi:N-acyl-D-amino-acid deacylase
MAVVSQGITSIIVGQDGGSETPLRHYFEKLGDTAVAVNVGSYSGHNTIRSRVMGDDFKREATPKEIEKMVKWLRDDLEAGALGLSTGLEYDPGIYSNRSEVLALASVLPEFGGRYISHLRSEDRYFWDALQEIIEIGRQTNVPVQISHFKLAMRSLWGKADTTLALLEKARAGGVNISADIYPYAYWSSTIRVLFPDRNFSDMKEAEFILREVTTPEGIVFSSYQPNPEYSGKTLAEVAQLEKKTAPAMLLELIKRLDACDQAQGDCAGSIVATSMEENDIAKLMQWEQTGICSDGASSGRHPRGFGAFTRVLGKYVREEKVLTLEQAIHKMTGLTSHNLGIEKRGLIKTGFFADLVLFDPATVNDRSTIAEPQNKSVGINRVWVNGAEVFNGDTTTGSYPGQVIRRNQAK